MKTPFHSVLLLNCGLFFARLFVFIGLFAFFSPVACNPFPPPPQAGPGGCLVAHGLLQRGCYSPLLWTSSELWQASAGSHAEEALLHCSQRGLCFMKPHSIASRHLPQGQRQFLFHGEQWMMVASLKGNNPAWGKQQQQQEKATVSMDIHNKHQ